MILHQGGGVQKKASKPEGVGEEDLRPRRKGVASYGETL